MVSLETVMVAWVWLNALLSLVLAVVNIARGDTEVCEGAQTKAATHTVSLFIYMLILIWMKAEGWW